MAYPLCRYGAGHHFGVHVDNAVHGDILTGLRIRTDLSVTFLPVIFRVKGRH